MSIIRIIPQKKGADGTLYHKKNEHSSKYIGIECQTTTLFTESTAENSPPKKKGAIAFSNYTAENSPPKKRVLKALFLFGGENRI